MSKKLSLSAAFSVFTMAAFALFSTQPHASFTHEQQAEHSVMGASAYANAPIRKGPIGQIFNGE